MVSILLPESDGIFSPKRIGNIFLPTESAPDVELERMYEAAADQQAQAEQVETAQDAPQGYSTGPASSFELGPKRGGEIPQGPPPPPAGGMGWLLLGGLALLLFMGRRR